MPATIVADGMTPVGPALAEWISSLPDGTPDNRTLARLGPFADYCTDQSIDGIRKPYTIRPSPKQHFELRGQASTLIRHAETGARKDAHLRLAGWDNFAVRQLAVFGAADGSNGYVSSLEAQHGFELDGCTNGALTACTADAVWGDKIYLGKSGDQWCDSIVLEQCGGGHSHRHCLAVAGAQNVWSRGAQWGTCNRTGIDLEPPGHGGGAVNIRCVTDTWKYHGLGWLAAVPAHGTVSGIIMDGCHSLGKELSLRVGTADDAELGDFTIRDCYTDTATGNPFGAAMRFEKVKGAIVVTGNTQPLQAKRPPPPMRVARFKDCTGPITYEHNHPEDLG